MFLFFLFQVFAFFYTFVATMLQLDYGKYKNTTIEMERVRRW